MISGNDFIILTRAEVSFLYNVLSAKKELKTYKDLAEGGVLDIVQYMEKFLFEEDMNP